MSAYAIMNFMAASTMQVPVVKLLLLMWSAVLGNTTSSNASVLISSPTALQDLLCSNECSPTTVITLNSSIQHFIDSKNFCVMNKTSCATNNSLTLKSSDATNYAIIYCVNSVTNGSTVGAGIAMIDSNVTFHRITFSNCSSPLKLLPSGVLNILNTSSPSNPVVYRDSYAAGLVLVNCTINIRKVLFDTSSIGGLGMVGVNIDSPEGIVELSQKSTTVNTAGNGFLLHFLTNDKLSSNNRTIVLQKLVMEDIHQYIATCRTPAGVGKYLTLASGLTLIFAQENFQVNVNLSDSFFHRMSSEAIAIYQFNCQSSTYVSRSKFVNLFSSFNCPDLSPTADSISFYMKLQEPQSHFIMTSVFKTQHQQTYSSLSPLQVLECLFDNDVQFYTNNKKSIIKVLISRSTIITNTSLHINIKIIKTRFIGFKGTEASMCVHAISEAQSNDNISTTLTLENINVTSNYIKKNWLNGILVFENINDVRITGQRSIFADNHGSPLRLIDSLLTINGHVEFTKNQAANGGAIQLIGRSQLVFSSTEQYGVEAIFYKNSANFLGGAIYADTTTDTVECPFCFSYNLFLNGPVAKFLGNQAGLSGSSIYSKVLFGCRFCGNNYVSSPKQVMKNLTTYFNFKDNSSLFSISTLPQNLSRYLVRFPNSNNAGKLYPGQTVEIDIAALDALGRPVYSPILLQINCRNKFDLTQQHSTPLLYHCTNDILLSSSQNEQSLFENRNLSTVNVTIYSRNQPNFANSFRLVNVNLYIPYINKGKTVHLLAYNQCPLGFSLNKKSGLCECSDLIYKLNPYSYYFCSISNAQFSASILQTWAGYVNISGSRYFTVSDNCPSEICNIKLGYHYYVSTEEGLKRMSTLLTLHSVIHDHQAIPICNKHRTGPLCGACEDGYSLSLTTSECKDCSNRFLALNIVLFLIYGPLLIAFMFIFTLTLSTGALNGILFAANLANIGVIDLMTLYNPNDVPLATAVQISLRFIEMLNANPLFPSCLYNGMDELWKTGIKMMHQFYLWAIIILLMWLTRYSTWLTEKLGRSSIKVFVTIFHISASRMFITLVNVFVQADIFIEGQAEPRKVWYFDGTIFFMRHHHLVLSMITLAIVFPLLVTYLFALIFPKKINKTSIGNKYCRPLLEAIHAPYKEGKTYWFALRILLLIILYCIYAAYRGTNYYLLYHIILPILVFFIMAQIYAQPFKNKFINILDLATMVNYLILGMTTLYYVVQGSIEPVVIECVISTLINMMILILFIFYRILVILRNFNSINRLFNRVRRFLCFKWNKLTAPSSSNCSSTLTSSDMFLKYAADRSIDRPNCDDREPLLNS